MKNFGWILLFIVFVLVLVTFRSKMMEWFSKDDQETEYKAIRKYLLNDSPLYGFNKPKLWIHTKYDINARNWLQTRNTTDLNQPYLLLTVQSIVNHCSEDFHICLINDESFSKLIPSWDASLSAMPEPLRSQTREIALLQLVYYYGGMVVPDSFVCLQNLLPLYQKASRKNIPWVAEQVNRTCQSMKKERPVFLPSSYMMATPKNNATVLEWIEFLKGVLAASPHFSQENRLLGVSQDWAAEAIQDGKMDLLDGTLIGIKKSGSPSVEGRPVLLEDLLGEDFIPLTTDLVGIYIPEDEVLSRTKYQWFAVLSQQEILDSRMIVAKYLLASAVDAAAKGHVVRSMDSA